jgi:hypothetical protein
MLTPAQRTLRSRIAANTLHAQGRTNTRPATAAFLRRFELEVDPAGTLSPEDRARRAEHALAAHMQRLSLAASKARAKKRTAPVTETSGAVRGGRRVAVDDPRAA